MSFLENWLINHGKVAKNVVSLVAIHFVLALLGFITRVKIANILGRESFGDFAFAVAVGTYGAMFVKYGLEKSFVRDLVHFPCRFGELLKASLILRVILFFILMLGFAVVVPRIERGSGYSLRMVPVFLATVLTAYQLQSVYDAWREMRRHAIFFMLEKCVYFVLVWSAVFLPFVDLNLGLIGIFLMVSIIVGLTIQYRWALPRIKFTRVDGLLSAVFFIVRSNFWVWLAVLSGLSLNYLSQIILKLYCGSAELGGFSAALMLVQLAILFLNQVGRVGLEATARHTLPGKTVNQRKYFVVKYALFMALMGLVIGSPCFLFPRAIFHIFRSEYSDAASTLKILGFYPLFYGPYLVVLQYVVSCRMQKIYFGLMVLASAISIGLNVLFIPKLQGIGAAISLVVSLAVSLVLFALVIRRHFDNFKSNKFEVSESEICIQGL